jgi:LuxR family maltose regulon positive regulatory protein
MYNCVMSASILGTKLYIPLPRPNAVSRPRLIARLDEGLHGKLTLLSAPAGYGKTALLSEWLTLCGRKAAWLSLDEGDGKTAHFLARGDPAAAGQIAEAKDLPKSRARVKLALGEASASLAVLEPYRALMDEKRWEDERLKAMILQSLAYHALGERRKATILIGEALTLAEPEGFVRTFVDEGSPMAALLGEAAGVGIKRDYIGKLLAAFRPVAPKAAARSAEARRASVLGGALSARELEVLHLIAQGLSNGGIGERLFLSLSTVKGHNLRLFEKLRVRSRTEAVARARSLGLL